MIAKSSPDPTPSADEAMRRFDLNTRQRPTSTTDQPADHPRAVPTAHKANTRSGRPNRSNEIHVAGRRPNTLDTNTVPV